MRIVAVCVIFFAIALVSGESGRRREVKGVLKSRERNVERKNIGSVSRMRSTRRGRRLERRPQGRSIVVKGNDCEFICLADITSNSGCSNGQKFVLKVSFCCGKKTLKQPHFLGRKQHTEAVSDRE